MPRLQTLDPCRFICLLLFFGGGILVGSGYGQQTEGIERLKQIETPKPDSSYFLGHWVIRSSIRVHLADSLLSDSWWRYEPEEGTWSLKRDLGSGGLDTTAKVRIRYRIYPYGLQRVYSRRELVPLDTTYQTGKRLNDGQQARRTDISEESLFGNVDIEKSGSLTRGFTVGSNKDLSLESGLQFDMQGQLTEDIEIIANLTDQSTPIQPDGSTQNLREFDKVFIQMRSPSTEVRLGDVDISLQRSEFARFTRRLQGAAGSYSSAYGEAKAALSVARGKFKTMQFDGRDGLQGPYRLTGEQGEQFITVLAGTEQVYVNGERVYRGEQNAYTIDYGLGEIHFTNNQIITDETRIVVDFQYINRDYNRSLVTGQAHADSLLDGKLSLTTTYVREADSDELGARLSLSEQELQALREAGDEQALVSGVDSVGYDPEGDYVLYSRVDTTYNNQSYTIYQNRPGQEGNVYRVRFTDVGTGEGAYRRVGSTVNGILYQWVGPGEGSYTPSERLPSPIRHDMLSVQSEYELFPGVHVFGEWAGSKFDQNRLSNLDDADNEDMGYLAGVRMDSIRSDAGLFSAGIRRRHTGKSFRYFGRTRTVEFDRKWNITGGDENAEENITEGNIRYRPSADTDIRLSGGRINRTGMQSNRQQLRVRSSEAEWPDLFYRLERIESRDGLADQQGLWYRHRGQIDHEIGLGAGELRPSFSFEQESREQRSVRTDTLTPLSERFYEVGPGLRYSFKSITIGGQITYRRTRDLLNQKIREVSTGLTRQISVQFSPGAHFSTKNEVAFRKKEYVDAYAEEYGSRDSRGVLIRSTTNYSTRNRFVDGQLIYEANTERRALMQETYIEVGPEIGQYVWRDTNDDGVQQIDEFFQELSPNEGIYVKQFVPSDELFPVIDLRSRLKQRWHPGALMDVSEFDPEWKQVISNIELTSLIEIRETSTTDQLSDIYLLNLDEFRNDSTTIEGRLYWQQSMQIFPDKADYDLRLQLNQNRSLNQKAVGLERDQASNYLIRGSYRLESDLIFDGEFRYSTDRSSSQRLANRNFDITTLLIKPGIDYIFSRSARAGVDVAWSDKSDRYGNRNTSVDMWKIVPTIQAYLFDRIQTHLRVEWRSVRINGTSTPLGLYELTEGAGTGRSWRWSLRASYRISNLLNASLNYDGRTIREENPIQSLRFVINATF